MSSIDYKESFAFAEFLTGEILPNLSQQIPCAINFADYLQAFYKYKQGVKTFGMPCPYVYTLDWIKEYKDRCVTFFYNDPEAVSKGASIISAVYQFLPNINALGNIHLWREDGYSDGHVTIFYVYESLDGILNKLKGDLNFVKKPRQAIKGFNVVED